MYHDIVEYIVQIETKLATWQLMAESNTIPQHMIGLLKKENYFIKEASQLGIF